jgi:hypothetical protein
MNKNNLTPYESLLIGIIGGTSETFLQMPLLTFKFCKQNGTKLPTNLRGWYRGGLIQVYNIAPITAFQMMSNNILTKIIVQDNFISYKEKVGIASLAGSLSSLLYSPIDLITIQQQKHNHKITKTITNIKNKYGLKTFYKGLLPCAIRESIYTGGYLGLAPITSNYIHNNFDINIFYSAVYGSLLTGTITSLITHPFDTTKTIIQTEISKKNNTFTKMKYLIKNHGISYLYKGCIPRSLKISGAFMICNYVERLFIDIKKELKK